MYELTIRPTGYSNLQEFNTLSLQAARKYKNEPVLEISGDRQSIYSDFRIDVQYRSGTDIHGQADVFDFLITKEFEFPPPATDGTTVSDARDLISENEYFGIKETSGRISAFVLNGAGDNIEKLTAGREGMLRGFKEAEKVWGGRLPEISYSTLEKALKQVDDKIHSLQGSIIDRTI